MMAIPGEYAADETQGITRVEALPKPKLVKRSRNYKRRPCPLCGYSAYRLRTATRTLHDLGDPLTGQRIARGFDQLRTLRSIMDEVYRLFDRRRRTDTALEKAGKLRGRIRRFTKLKNTLKKLWSPNFEKALTFLDDSLPPSTSNAVERANRRHRKMQKSVYRVRTGDHISQRIAVDMQRDKSSIDIKKTVSTLHWNRSYENRKTG